MSTPAFPIAEKEANKIMYIALMIDKNVLMGNDFPEFMGKVN
jgi:PhnB protein